MPGSKLRLGLFVAIVLSFVVAVGVNAQESIETPPPAASSEAEAPPVQEELTEADIEAFLERSHEQLKTGVENRLLHLLEILPQRWSALPAPKIPYSGRDLNQALQAASQDDTLEAAAAFLLYSKLPLEMRSAVLEKLLEREEHTEATIWAPGLLVQRARIESAAEEAVLIEAWFGWAEALGRQDALFFVASDAADLLLRRQGMGSLVETMDSWAALPTAPEIESGKAYFYRSQADVLFRLGKSQEAIEAYRKARTLFEDVGDRLGQGNAWKGEADGLFLLGRNQEAIEAYRKARTLFEDVGDRLGQGNAWKGEADVLFRLGKNQEAIEAYRKARTLFEDDGDRLGQGNAWSGEADVLFRLGKNQEAIEAYRKARTLFEDDGDQLGQGNAWKGEAKALLRIGSYPEAASAARRSLEFFSALRSGYLDESARQQLQNSIASIYDVLVPALANLGQSAEALVAAEEAKSRVFLDLIAGHFPERVIDEEAFDYSQKKRELQARLAQLANDENGAANGSARNRQLQAEIDRQLEQTAFENLLVAKTELVEAHPLTFAQVTALVEQTGPILGFYVAEEQTFAYLLAPQKEPLLRALPLSWGALRRRAPELGEQLANENYFSDAEKNSHSLWQDLLGAFKDDLPASGPLLIVPHGPLHQLPFEALIDEGGHRLVERFDLSFSPSLASLAHLRERHHPAKSDDRLLALASGRGLSLPLQEIRAIGSLFDPRQAADFGPEMATFGAYEKLAPRARHLLVASHAEYVQGNLRQTYLEIQPSSEHDHRLSAAEIATIPLPKLELVVLAACDTAASEALPSDERLDLSRAFLVAGAAAVLATRWQVPDDPRTTQFLVDFYRAYRGAGGKDPQRKDVALSEARRLSIERGDPSAIWAAWVLIGDPR